MSPATEGRSNIWDIVTEDERGGDRIEKELSPLERALERRRLQNRINQRNRRKKLQEASMVKTRSQVEQHHVVEVQTDDHSNSYSLRKRPILFHDQVDQGHEGYGHDTRGSQTHVTGHTPQEPFHPLDYHTQESSGQYGNDQTSPRGRGGLRGRNRGRPKIRQRGRVPSKVISPRRVAVSKGPHVRLAEISLAQRASVESQKGDGDYNHQAISASFVGGATDDRASSYLSDGDDDEDSGFVLDGLHPRTADPFSTSQMQRTRDVEARSTMAHSSPLPSTTQTNEIHTAEQGRADQSLVQSHAEGLLEREANGSFDFLAEMSLKMGDSLAELESYLKQAQAPITSFKETLRQMQADMSAMRSERDTLQKENLTLQADRHRLIDDYKQVKVAESDKDARILDLAQTNVSLTIAIEELSEEKSQLETNLHTLKERISAIRRAAMELTDADE